MLRSEDPLFDAMRCIVSALVFLVISFSSAYYVFGTNYDHEIDGLETKLDAHLLHGHDPGDCRLR